ncbi:MAG TPA: tetratricopeptide repeat protein, partial [Magnetococcales bacterium]|nr:tetratricopeptide repeat protein [Magnetococcales bacterium]
VFSFFLVGVLLGASGRAGGAEFSVPSALPFLSRMVGYLEGAGRFGEAVRYQERLVYKLSTLKGGDHAQVFRARNRWARLLVLANRMEEARQAFAKIEKDLLRVVGERHFETAMARFNLAQLALLRPEPANEALRLMDTVLPVFGDSLWPDHPRWIEAMVLRARALSSLERKEEAEVAFGAALAHGTAQFGSDDVHVAEILSERGWNRTRMGRFAEGIGDMERGLTLLERVLPPWPFKNRIHLLGRLAEGYLRGGQQSQARAMLEKIVAVMVEKHGENHAALIKPLTDLGMVELELEQRDRAEAYLKRALALVQNLQQLDHPQRAFILTILGDLFWRQDRQEEADRYFAAAEAAATTFFAGDAVGLANWLASMGVIVHQGGNKQRAVALFSRSLQLLESALGKDDPVVVGVRKSLLPFLAISGSSGAAANLGTSAVPSVEKEKGTDETMVQEVVDLSKRRRALLDAFQQSPEVLRGQWLVG